MYVGPMAHPTDGSGHDQAVGSDEPAAALAPSLSTAGEASNLRLTRRRQDSGGSDRGHPVRPVTQEELR